MRSESQIDILLFVRRDMKYCVLSTFAHAKRAWRQASTRWYLSSQYCCFCQGAAGKTSDALANQFLAQTIHQERLGRDHLEVMKVSHCIKKLQDTPPGVPSLIKTLLTLLSTA